MLKNPGNTTRYTRRASLMGKVNWIPAGPKNFSQIAPDLFFADEIWQK
jgi:hypothetical protein